MEENLASTSSRLNASLDTWRAWDADLSARPVVIAELDGLSNTSYLVANDNIKLVLRLNSTVAELGVDRAIERAILQDLKSAPFAPTLLYHDEQIDFIVTEYTRGIQIQPADVDQYLEDIGVLFGDIHTSPVNIDALLDPMEQARRYYAHLGDIHNESLSWCYHALESRTMPSVRDVCLCHNDLLLENIVASDDRLVALDWEYASPGDPAFDLAVFIESYRLDEQAQARLLEACHGPATTSGSRITSYRLLYRLIEILWWMLRDPDHPAIADKLAYLEQQIKAGR